MRYRRFQIYGLFTADGWDGELDCAQYYNCELLKDFGDEKKGSKWSVITLLHSGEDSTIQFYNEEAAKEGVPYKEYIFDICCVGKK